MDISVDDFHRNSHMPLHTSRAENRAEGYSYASMAANHLADVFRMNSQFENSHRLSLDRTNLHLFGMVHESLSDHLQQLLHGVCVCIEFSIGNATRKPKGRWACAVVVTPFCHR